jgi:hypothetical protein
MRKGLRRATIAAVIGLLILGAVAGWLWFSPDSPYQRGRYVPADLDAAHKYLLKHLPAEDLQQIRAMKSEDEMSVYHFGAGLWMRNRWGLWGGSRLARYFRKLGIEHPDEMSGIILRTFWCKLHQQPFRIAERVALSRAYQLAATIPSDLRTPTGEALEFNTTYHRGTPDKPRLIHIAKSVDGTVWTYEHDQGLHPMTPEIQRVIDEYSPPP